MPTSPDTAEEGGPTEEEEEEEEESRTPSPSRMYGAEPAGLADGQQQGCWVSRQLAMMIRVDTEKETMTMDNDSPRAFNFLNSQRHFEPNRHLVSPRRTPEPDSPRRGKLRQLTKQLSNVRKKLEQVEHEFKQKYGYRPSHGDKLNDKELKYLLSEQTRLKREIKGQKENTDVPKESLARKNSGGNKDIGAIKATLEEMLQRLEEGRLAKNRPYETELMTLEQIFDEKLEMHAVLLEFEKIHGHPESKEEKEIMKVIYERYRVIKRLARRSSSVSVHVVHSSSIVPNDSLVS